jgi:type III restriction enzyme
LRVPEPRQNVLTVIANESYEQFVATLQAEMEEAFGKEGIAPRPVNAREKKVARRKPLEQLPQDFVDLWGRIKLRTRYQVTVDSEALVADVVAALDKIKIEPPRIVAEKAAVSAAAGADRLDVRLVGKSVLASLVGRQAVPNLVELLEDLIAHVWPPLKLTRRTLAAVVTRIGDRQAALDNPQEFATRAAQVIRSKAVEQLVAGIEYQKDGTWYAMSEWVEEEPPATPERLVAVEKSIYDHVVVQSETERKFAERLKSDERVRLFVKLPGWFRVRTPVGDYNPDWALVMEEVDAHGDPGPVLYLVRETKSSTLAEELRGTENQKVRCGERHFKGALGVNYKVMTSDGPLP